MYNLIKNYYESKYEYAWQSKGKIQDIVRQFIDSSKISSKDYETIYH